MVVTDEELRKALSNSDNKGVLNRVLLGYNKVLTKEELDSCGLLATWRALQKHRPEYGQKFTTSLYRFAHWECRRELRAKRNKKNLLNTISFSHKKFDIASPQKDTDEIKGVRECLSMLPENHRNILIQYYYDRMTMEEIGEANSYSKELARQRISKALVAFDKIYSRCMNI